MTTLHFFLELSEGIKSEDLYQFLCKIYFNVFKHFDDVLL